MAPEDSVEKQLAREEALLVQTRRQILSMQEKIQRAERQAVELREQLAALEGQVGPIQKRVALLRQYIEMAPPALNATAAAEAEIAQEEEILEDEETLAEDEEEGGFLIQEEEAGFEEIIDGEPVIEVDAGELNLDDGVLDNVTVGMPPGLRSVSDSAPGSFEDLDDESLAMELLPRTQTFEEELLLILAHHRKAVEPKDVARLFRRLDHAPKVKPTENNVKAQVASAPHLYEQTTEGRMALSQEGREEAQRLLMSLA